MDDLFDWYDVIRSLMPLSCTMRIVPDRRGILVASRDGERLVWVTEDDLAGRFPGEVVCWLRTELQHSATRLPLRAS